MWRVLWLCVCAWAQSWIDMTDTSRQLWYPRQLDQERLDSDNTTSWIHEHRYPDHITLGYGQRVGWTWPNPQLRSCTLPLRRRSYLQKELASFPHSTLVNWPRVFPKNHTLILIGDSLSRQNMDALAADLSRFPELLLVDVGKNAHPHCNAKSTVRRSIPDHLHPCIVNYEGNTELLVVHAPSQPPFHIYYTWHTNDATWNQTRATVEHIASHYASVTVVFNQGLWGPTTHGNLRVLDWFQNWLVQMNEPSRKGSVRTRVLWRETTAGHFPTPDGWRKHEQHTACVPHADTTLTSPEHELLHKHLQHNARDDFRFIPFFRTTAEAWDLHIVLRSEDSLQNNIHPPTLDCLHYCWTPMLWQPVLHAIAQAMQM